MAVEIKIPKLGLTMKEATVAQWLIKAGNPVAEKQIVCVIETDKVTFEVPAPASGLVYPIASPGQRFAVGEVIGYIAVDEIELKGLGDRQTDGQTRPREAPPNREQGGQRGSLPIGDRPPAGGGRVIATPVARKLALEQGIDLHTVSGSGAGGRIMLEDVERAVEALSKKPAERDGWISGHPRCSLPPKKFPYAESER